MNTKSFNECSVAYVSKTFSLKRLLKSTDLDSWLAEPAELTAYEKENLGAL